MSKTTKKEYIILEDFSSSETAKEKLLEKKLQSYFRAKEEEENDALRHLLPPEQRG